MHPAWYALSQREQRTDSTTGQPSAPPSTPPSIGLPQLGLAQRLHRGHTQWRRVSSLTVAHGGGVQNAWYASPQCVHESRHASAGSAASGSAPPPQTRHTSAGSSAAEPPT